MPIGCRQQEISGTVALIGRFATFPRDEHFLTSCDRGDGGEIVAVRWLLLSSCEARRERRA